jgi:hypothetical protein
MQTQTNVVRFSFLNYVLTSLIVSRKLSSFSIISGRFAPFSNWLLVLSRPFNIGLNYIKSWEMAAKPGSKH